MSEMSPLMHAMPFTMMNMNQYSQPIVGDYGREACRATAVRLKLILDAVLPRPATRPRRRLLTEITGGASQFDLIRISVLGGTAEWWPVRTVPRRGLHGTNRRFFASSSWMTASPAMGECDAAEMGIDPLGARESPAE